MLGLLLQLFQLVKTFIHVQKQRLKRDEEKSHAASLVIPF